MYTHLHSSVHSYLPFIFLSGMGVYNMEVKYEDHQYFSYSMSWLHDYMTLSFIIYIFLNHHWNAFILPRYIVLSLMYNPEWLLLYSLTLNFFRNSCPNQSFLSSPSHISVSCLLNRYYISFLSYIHSLLWILTLGSISIITIQV